MLPHGTIRLLSAFSLSRAGRGLARIIHKPSTAAPYLPALAASSSLADPQRVFQTRLRSSLSFSLPSEASSAPRYEVCE